MSATRVVDPEDVAVGAVLRELRATTAFSANAASELLGLGKSTVAMYERGDRTICVDRFLQLAKLYGVDPGLALDLMSIRLGRAEITPSVCR